MSRKKAFTAALKASSPVFFGYISIGFAYGFLLVKSGFQWYWAPVMSLTIFAGAAQFMAISLLNQNKGFIEMGPGNISAECPAYGIRVLGT